MKYEASKKGSHIIEYGKKSEREKRKEGKGYKAIIWWRAQAIREIDALKRGIKEFVSNTGHFYLRILFSEKIQEKLNF